MKKTVCFLTLLVGLLFLVPVAAYAADNTTYTLDELDMTISIPTDMNVTTREIDSEDPNLSSYDLNKNDVIDHFEKYSIYLDALSQDLTYEIIVTMITDESLQAVSDFNLFTDAELMEQNFESIYAAQHVTVLSMELLSPRHPQAKFYKLSLSNADRTSYRLQFYTVINNKAINISIAADYPIDETLESRITEVVNSVTFMNLPTAEASPNAMLPGALQEEEPSSPPEPIYYHDDEAGVSFIVPDGWTEKGLFEDREYIQKKYTDSAGNTLLFGYSDLYAKLPKGYSRSDVTNEMFSKADLENTYTLDGSHVTSVEYATVNGIEYFCVSRDVSAVTNGIGVESNIMSYILYYNGIMYEFSAGDAMDTDVHADFMAWMSTVRYDDITTGVLKESLDLPYNASDKLGAITVILSIVFTVVIYSAPILIYRYAVKKEPVSAAKARKITIIYGATALVIVIIIGAMLGDPSPGGAVFLWSFINYRVLVGGKSRKKHVNVPEHTTEAKRMTCPSCEADLPEDSVFCEYCGKKITD